MVGLRSIYRHNALNQSWVNVGLPSVTLAYIQRGAKPDTVTRYWDNDGSASFFVTADMLKEIFDHIQQFSLSKKNAVLDQNLS